MWCIFRRENYHSNFCCSERFLKGIYIPQDIRKHDSFLYFLFSFFLIWIIHSPQVMRTSIISFLKALLLLYFISLSSVYLNIAPISLPFRKVKTQVYLKYVFLIYLQYIYLAICLFMAEWFGYWICINVIGL